MEINDTLDREINRDESTFEQKVTDDIDTIRRTADLLHVPFEYVEVDYSNGSVREQIQSFVETKASEMGYEKKDLEVYSTTMVNNSYLGVIKVLVKGIKNKQSKPIFVVAVLVDSSDFEARR